MLGKNKTDKNSIDVKIKTKHIIMFSKLISKMGFKFNPTGKNTEELGAEIIFGILENLHKAETELYELISSLSGYNVEKVSELEITELKEVLNSITVTILDFFPKPTETVKV